MRLSRLGRIRDRAAIRDLAGRAATLRKGRRTLQERRPHVRQDRPPPRPPRLSPICGRRSTASTRRMHRLLMERGAIIDRLIAVKKTRRFRLRLPAGPRGLDDAGARRAPRGPAAARHGRGHLARHHRAPSPMCRRPTRSMPTFPAAMRRCATRPGSISASRCPTSRHPSAAAVIEAVAASRGDLGIFRLDQGASSGAWWRTLADEPTPEDHRPPALHRASRPSGRHAGLRHLEAPDRCGRARRGALCRPVRALAQGRRRGPRQLGGEVVASAADASGLSELIAVPGSVEPAALQGRARPRRARASPSSPRSAAMPNVSA